MAANRAWNVPRRGVDVAAPDVVGAYACRFVYVLVGAFILGLPAASAATDDGAPDRIEDDESADIVAVLVPVVGIAASDLERPPILPTFYVSFTILQAYDTYASLEGAKRQFADENPIVRILIQSPAAFVAVKLGATAVSIYAAERLWRRGQRKQAVFLVVLANVAMAYVAYRNTSTLRNTN